VNHYDRPSWIGPEPSTPRSAPFEQDVPFVTGNATLALRGLFRAAGSTRLTIRSPDAPAVRDDAQAHLGAAGPGELIAEEGRSGTVEEKVQGRPGVREMSRKSFGLPRIQLRMVGVNVGGFGGEKILVYGRCHKSKIRHARMSNRKSRLTPRWLAASGRVPAWSGHRLRIEVQLIVVGEKQRLRIPESHGKSGPQIQRRLHLSRSEKAALPN
jgi:hypothetical protein